MVTGMLFGQSGDTDPVPAGAASSSTRGPSLKRTGSPTRGREAAASRGPRLDPPQQDYQPTDLPGYQPDLSEFDATTILPSPKGSPVKHDIATAENSPEKQRNGNGESDVMQNLVATMLAMQQSLAQLTQRIEKSETKKEDAPKIDHKDIQKPDRYSGPKWSLWSEEFKGFLRRRDKRWAVLLDEIQGKSKKPLTDDDYSDIQAAMGIEDEEVYFAFQQQLYEYLKSYTTGEPLSMVLANGVTKALESWRRMADQGRSARERPMRDERRALYHPKQAGLSDVIEAISSWEKKLAEYQRIKTKDIMSDEDKIMCLEDICPEVLQRHLSEQQALGQVESYNSYKAAIEEYFHNERRWGKKHGGIRHVAPAPCEEADCQHAHAHGASEADPQDAADGWAADLMVQINALNALVRNNFSKKGKGKGNFPGPTNPGKGNAMDVDPSGGDTKPNYQQKRKCYECGEEGHIGRECPVRQAIVANGGPPILPKGGKEGKGGKYGKDGKGGGKNGKAGKGWWPNQTEWRQMYPGPSPSMWNSWYPHAGQPSKGGANVFDIPQALSPLSPCAPPGSSPSLSPIQQLFQSGAAFGVYSLTEKRKATKAEVETPKKCSTVPPSDKSFAHPNAFSALQSEDEDEGPSPALTVNLVDAIKPPSANQARKARERATRSRRGEATTATKSTSTKSTSSFPTLSKSALYAVEQIKKPQSVEDITTATLQSPRLTRSAATAQASVRVPSFGLTSRGPSSPYALLQSAQEYAKDKNDLPNPESEMTPTEHRVTPKRAAYSKPYNTTTRPTALPVRPTIITADGAQQDDLESVAELQRNADDFEYEAEMQWDTLKANVLHDVPGYKHKPTARPHRRDRGPDLEPVLAREEFERRCLPNPTTGCDSNAEEELMKAEDMTCMKRFTEETDFGNPEKVLKALQQLNFFSLKADKQGLNQVGKQADSAQRSGRWEVLKAIIDSGATVPVIHPKVGRDYDLEESEASRAGVEYETANDDTVPNLGQKRMAVLTQEGTVRGYQSQCANVGKSLQSVRSMVKSKSAVCFGLGPDGNDHFIINRVSGEVNRIEDDGINYIQRLLIIPPDQVNAVQQKIAVMKSAEEYQFGHHDGTDAQDFPGPGR